MAFEFLLKLNDMVSDPAQKISRQLFELEQRLRGLDIVSRQAQITQKTSTMKRAVLELQIQRQQLMLNRNEMLNSSRVTATLADRFRHMRESTRDWLLILTPLTMGLRFIYNQTQQLAHAMMGPIRAVEEAALGMRTIFGAQVGDELLKSFQELGPRIGRPIKDIFEQATKYAVAGAPANMLEPMIMAVESLKAMGKDTSQLEYMFTQTWSRPVASIHEMIRGMSRVVNEAEVWKQLSKDILGSDTPGAVGNLNKLISWNMISGGSLNAALMEVIQKMEGGVLGSTALTRADTTMGGMIDRLQARMEKLFMGIADTPGFATLKQAMLNLIEVLGDPKVQTIVDSIANSMGKIFEPFAGPDGKRELKNFFDVLKMEIESVLPGLRDLIQLTGKLAGWGLQGLGGIGITWEAIKNLATLGGYNSPASNVVNSAVKSLFNSSNSIQTGDQDFPGLELDPYQQYQNPDTYEIGTRTFTRKPNSRSAPNVSITVPLQIISDSNGPNSEYLPKEVRDEALRKFAETLDQINSQTP